MSNHIKYHYPYHNDVAKLKNSDQVKLAACERALNALLSVTNGATIDKALDKLHAERDEMSQSYIGQHAVLSVALDRLSDGEGRVIGWDGKFYD